MSVTPSGEAPGHYPGYGQVPGAGQQDGGPGLAYALGIVRRRWWLLAITGAIAFGAAWYLLPEDQVRHRAVAVVLLDDPRQFLSGVPLDFTTLEDIGTPEFIVAQQQVIRSNGVVGEVVDREALRFSPSENLPRSLFRDLTIDEGEIADTIWFQFRPTSFVARTNPQSSRGSYGEPVEIGGIQFTLMEAPQVAAGYVAILPRDLAIAEVVAGLYPQRRTGATIIDVGYVDDDPVQAQRVANAVAEAYRAQNTRIVQESARRRREFLYEQWQRAEENFQEAEGTLAEFRGYVGSYSPDERRQIEEGELLQLDLARRDLDFERRSFSNFLSRVEGATGAEIDEELRTLMASLEGAPSDLFAARFSEYTRYQQERQELFARGRALTNPEVARITALMETLREQVIDDSRTQVASLDQRLASVNQQRAEISRAMAASPEMDTEEGRLIRGAEQARDLSDGLRSEYQQALTTESLDIGQVQIMDAAQGAVPIIEGNRIQKLVIALMFGLLLGTGGALVIEMKNPAVRGRIEGEALLSLPALAVIPRIGPSSAKPLSPGQRTGRKGAAGHTDLAEVNFHSTAAEAYRRLRTNLSFLQSGNAELRTLAVTSASSGDGKTTTAANLAVAFARQGRRVLLVDCDLRRPRLHRIFKTDATIGFTDVLQGRSSGAAHVAACPRENLFFLPRGEFDENAAEMMSGPGLQRILRQFRENYDLVIFDTSPVLLAAESTVLAASVDGVVLVVRAGETRRQIAQEAYQQLHSVGAHVVGFVLNDPDAVSARYGEYTYGKHYYAMET